MTPWEETRDLGGFGQQGIRLLYETVEAVRRFSGFPPPPEHERWDEAAVTAVAHDFASGPTRVAGLLLRATDEGSFERLLDAAVRNFLRSQYRKTEAGRMMRALRRIVENDQQVVTVPPSSSGAGCWALPAHAGDPPFAGRTAELIEAAFAVDGVRMARWRSGTVNRPPIAQSDSLRLVVRAVLAAAGSPVSPSTMLQVIAARFPLAGATSVVSLTDLIEAQTPQPGGDRSAARLLAEEAWSQLSASERLVAGILDEPVREVAALTGLSRGSTHRAVLGAKRVLADLLGDESEPHAIIGELREMSDLLRERGTQRAGLASIRDEEH